MTPIERAEALRALARDPRRTPRPGDTFVTRHGIAVEVEHAEGRGLYGGLVLRDGDGFRHGGDVRALLVGIDERGEGA